MRRLALSLVVAAAAAALAAPALSAAAPPSAWARSADALCLKANADSSKLPTVNTSKGRIATIEGSIVIGDRLANALAKLPRPAADAAAIAKLVGVYRQAVALMRDVVVAMRVDDSDRLDRDLDRATLISASFSSAAKRLGALHCAQ